ncbi:MAG: hypothetical protein U9R79_09405 [Armatimonadota bacterium]|nr:hypothetical protein [Armatimonadota bacterium]
MPDEDVLIGAHDWFGGRAVLPAAHLLEAGTVVIGEGARALYDRFKVRYDAVVDGPEEYFELVDAHTGPFMGPVPTMHPLDSPEADETDRRSTLSDCFRARSSAHAIPRGTWESRAGCLPVGFTQPTYCRVNDTPQDEEG